MSTMTTELSHSTARAYFPDLVDQELEPVEEAKVRGHLALCRDCRSGWERYERTVEKVRKLQREKAPDALASVILRRARKRGRFGLRAIARAHQDYRMPYEIIIPVILGAAIAALLVTMLAG